MEKLTPLAMEIGSTCLNSDPSTNLQYVLIRGFTAIGGLEPMKATIQLLNKLAECQILEQEK
jgi:hypothetical protein